MKKEDKDLLVELVNNLQEELDVMWDSIADVEQALDKLDRAVNTEPDNKRHDDMWDRLLMLDQIISRNRPDWVGKWEEENCEGGGKCPEDRSRLILDERGRLAKSKGMFKRWLRKIRKRK